jgi:DnaK suppressor protein
MPPSPSAAPRAHLRAERDRVARLEADLADELAGIMTSAAGDLPDDEHDVEGSSIGFERARVTALLRATRQRRAELEAALARAEGGAEVRCRGCGGPIGAERLLALPGITTCVVCSAASASASASAARPGRLRGQAPPPR